MADPTTSILTEASQAARHAIHRAGGLVTATDLAGLWGCSYQWAQRVTRRPDFPPPVLIAGRVRVWLRSDADLYARR